MYKLFKMEKRFNASEGFKKELLNPLRVLNKLIHIN